MNCLLHWGMKKMQIGKCGRGMFMRKFISYFLVVIFSMQNICSVENSKQKRISIKQKITSIMIPKCGTHLLLKCLHLLDGHMSKKYNQSFPFEKWYAANKPRNMLPPPNHYKGLRHPTIAGNLPTRFIKYMEQSTGIYFDTHFHFTSEFNNFLDMQNSKKILMIRDPRAFLVSFAFMVKEGFEQDQHIDLEPLMLDLIDGRQQNYIHWGVSRHASYPWVWETGVCNFFKAFLPFIETKNCLVVKFEHLVGAKGGGSDALQMKEIKMIAQHIGVKIDNLKVKKIAQDLFGDSTTFREGKIDGWKNYFSPTIKEAFKKVPGANALLIALGYERDENW